MKRQTLHIALNVAATAIGTLIALYLLATAYIDRGQLQSRMQSLKKELSEKQRRLDNHSEYKGQLEEMRLMLTQVRVRLPARLDASSLEKILRDKATLAGMDTTSAHVGTETVEEGFYAALPDEVIVQGSATGFLKFMDSILRDDPLRSVTAMNIAPVDNAVELRAALTLTYFRYIEEDE
jgi:Tfp pilus assembly protein PilO